MGPRTSLGGFKRIFLGIFGQGVQSLFQILIAILLIRNAEKADYGFFSLALTTMSFWASGVNAAASALIVPKISGAFGFGQRRLLANFGALILFLNGLGFVLLSVVFINVGASLSLALSAAALSVGFSTRQHFRTIAYSRNGNRASLLADILYAVFGCFLLALLWLIPHKYWAISGLLIMTLSQCVSSFRLSQALSVTRTPIRIWPHLRRLKEFRRGASQSVFSALSGSLVTAAPSFIVASAWGSNIVAVIAASQVLLGPLRIVLTPVLPMMRAEYSRTISKNGVHSGLKMMILAVTIMISAAALAEISIILLWPWLNAFLYKNNYASEPMLSLILLSLHSLAFQMVRFVINPYLGALERYGDQAKAAFWGAVVCIAGCVIVAYRYDPRYVMMGSLVGNLVTLSMELYFLLCCFRRTFR